MVPFNGKLWLLCLCSYLFIQSALCTISYGKLKIKVAGGNEAFLLHGRSTVAATRDSSYLNQDGDIFKLYKPAISADAPPDSISFESLRYPGTFLRANIRRGSLDFRMDRPLPGDLHFNKSASFIIKKNTGVRGTGMLSSMDKPNYFMCATYNRNSNPILQAVRDDSLSKKSNLKETCSFYIQKLTPLAPLMSPRIGAHELHSIDHPINANARKKDQRYSMRESLEKLAKSLDASHDMGKFRDVTSAILNFQKGVAPPTYVRKLLTDYEDNTRNFQQVAEDTKHIQHTVEAPIETKNLLAEFPTQKVAKKKELHSEEPKSSRGRMRNILANPSPPPLQVSLTKKETTVRFIGDKHLRHAQLAALNFLNSDIPLKNDTYFTESILNYLNPRLTGRDQAASAAALLTPHPVELTKMGPFTPVNLGDFSKQTHREPALNIDGLVNSINVPQTRSNVTAKTGSTRQHGEDKNLFINALNGNSNDTTEPPVVNKTSSDPLLTMYYVKPIHSAINKSISSLLDNSSVATPKYEMSSYIKSEPESDSNLTSDDIPPTDLTESNDTKLDEDSNDANNITETNSVSDENANKEDSPNSMSNKNDSKMIDNNKYFNMMENNKDLNMIENNKDSNMMENNNKTATNSSKPVESKETEKHKEAPIANMKEKEKEAPTSDSNDNVDDNNNSNDTFSFLNALDGAKEPVKVEPLKTNKNHTNSFSSKANSGKKGNNFQESLQLIHAQEKNKALPNRSDSVGKISIAASNKSDGEVKFVINKNDTVNETKPAKEPAVFDMSDPLRDLEKGMTSLMNNQTEQTVDDVATMKNKSDSNSGINAKEKENKVESEKNNVKNEQSEVKNEQSDVKNEQGDVKNEQSDVKNEQNDVINYTANAQNNTKSDTESSAEKQNAKIYSYNDDDGVNLDTKVASVFGNNGLDQTDQQKKEKANPLKEKKVKAHNFTSAVAKAAQNKTTDEHKKPSNVETTLNRNITVGANTTTPVDKNTFEMVSKDDPSKSITIKFNKSNTSATHPANAVEHVEFAKEIEHVEIAVSDKGQANNITKPVLAKSYVKDRSEGAPSHNATHTIDGNFVVKYDEPLSESTTREIANNIFKAVFNTLNKTAIPPVLPITSQGVERATIEKNLEEKFTDSLFSKAFEERMNNDDDDDNLFATAIKDKIPARNGSKNDEAKELSDILGGFTDNNSTSMEASEINKNETTPTGDQNENKNSTVQKEKETPQKQEKNDEDEKQHLNNKIEEDKLNRLKKEQKNMTESANKTKDEKSSSSNFPSSFFLTETVIPPKEKATFNKAKSDEKHLFPDPEVPTPADLKDVDVQNKEDAISKENKSEKPGNEENGQQKEPLVLGKKGKDDSKNEKTVEITDENKNNKTIKIPIKQKQKNTFDGSGDGNGGSEEKQLADANMSPEDNKYNTNKDERKNENDKEDKYLNDESPKEESNKNEKFASEDDQKEEKNENEKLVKDEPQKQEENNGGKGDSLKDEDKFVKDEQNKASVDSPDQKSNNTEESKPKEVIHKLEPTHDDEGAEQKPAATKHLMSTDDESFPLVQSSSDGGSAVHTGSYNPVVQVEPVTASHANAGPLVHTASGPGVVADSTHTDASPIAASHHDINVDQVTSHSLRRHTNHIITVKDDNEKETLLTKLVNYDYDKCVFMKLINDIKSPYRLISSVNRHGYKPRGMVFTLKTVLKDPDLHQFVAFRAIDENDPKRIITLDGQRDLVTVPVMCHGTPRVVHVESQQPPKAIANAMTRILSETRHVETAEDAHKKNQIQHPLVNQNQNKAPRKPIFNDKRMTHIKSPLPDTHANTKSNTIQKLSNYSPEKAASVRPQAHVKVVVKNVMPLKPNTIYSRSPEIKRAPYFTSNFGRNTISEIRPLTYYNPYTAVKSTVFRRPVVAKQQTRPVVARQPVMKTLISRAGIRNGVQYVEGLVNGKNVTVQYFPRSHSKLNIDSRRQTPNKKDVVTSDRTYKDIHLNNYFKALLAYHRKHRNDIAKRFFIQQAYGAYNG